MGYTINRQTKESFVSFYLFKKMKKDFKNKLKIELEDMKK